MMKPALPLGALVIAISSTIDGTYDDTLFGWEGIELDGDVLTLTFESSDESEFENAAYAFKLVRE